MSQVIAKRARVHALHIEVMVSLQCHMFLRTPMALSPNTTSVIPNEINNKME